MSMLSPFGNYGRYLARAIALTGMSKVLGEPFYDPMYMGFNAAAVPALKGPWVVNRTAGIGTTAGVALPGGVQRIGVTGGGAAGFSAFDLDANGACLFHAITELWYFGYRARSLTGVTATEGAYVGLVDAAGVNVLRVGLNGRASTTNFSIASGVFNTVVTSQVGPAIDTAFHDFEMWMDVSGSVGWAVDGVTQTPLAAPAFTDMHPFGIVEIAAVDVTCAIDVDNVFCKAGSTP